jgi:hypothetical protein
LSAKTCFSGGGRYMEILDGIILFSRNIDCIALQYITATLRYITLHYITYIHIQYIYKII